MFLRRNIYVLDFDENRDKPWSCRQYGPGVVSIKGKSIASFTERPVDIFECLDAIRAEIIDSSAPPIVLRFWGRQFSAVVPCPTVIAELPLQQGADMNIPASPPSTENLQLSNATSEDLAVGGNADQQLLQLKSNAGTSLITTDITTFTTANLQQIDGSPTSSIGAAERQLRKRSPITVPDERIQDGMAVKNIHTGILLKKGKPEEYALVQYLKPEDEPMGDYNRHWEVAWNRGIIRWPKSATVKCPLVDSGTAVWVAAAAAEPHFSLNHVQFFRFPGELINSLADSVIIQWTEHWRQECLQNCLVRYGINFPSQDTRAWLEQWMHQIELLKERKVAGNLGDNVDFWKQMRFNHYGNDEILRLCDFGRCVKFSHHMLCAQLYHVEIEELLSVTETSASFRTEMEGHLQLLHSDSTYQSCFNGDGTQVDWIGVANYFENAFAKPMAIDAADY